MANGRVGNMAGIAGCNDLAGDNRSNMNGGTNMLVEYNDEDADNVFSMKSRLNTIDPNAYSQANLHTMTYNDMLYALRVHDNPETIKQ